MSATATNLSDLVSLLTSFHGRIPRKQWWIGCVIALVASIVGTLLFDPAAFTAADDVLPPPQWADTIWQVVWLIPGTAITVKRFNDRDWPSWFGYALGAMGLFMLIAPHFGMLMAPPRDGAGAIVFWITFAIVLLAFVDNGFVRGTDGPNRYGPDPLERGAQPS